MPTLLTGPDCAVTRKGEFATQNLWVTPHADDERWPAGEGGDAFGPAAVGALKNGVLDAAITRPSR